MNRSINIRLALALGIAIVIFVSSTRGSSLDELLAPLPFDDGELTAAAEAKSKKHAEVDRHEEIFQPEVVLDGILASDVLQALEDALEWSLRPNGKLTLVPLRDLPDLSAYSSPFQVNLINAPGRLSRNNMMLRFQVENEKGIVGEWNLPYRAHLYSEVWFAKAHLRAGDVASPSDFEIREIDLLIDPDAVPAANEVLLRHEYSHDITPGKPLVWKDLTERSLVRKGDIIEVSAVQGLLAISMRAIARQDGSDGDLILLRNIDSAREFTARVIGANRAEIVF